MADNEVAATTESSGESSCISFWDLSSGMQIKSYKGGSCSPHGLSLLGGHYIMAAQTNKPVLHVWNLAKEQLHMKIICPGRISAVTCSPDGNYCIAACGEKIYIWQVASGDLLAIISRHYQRVSCLRFTDDGTHLLSGGDDNMVMVWRMADVLCQSSSNLSTNQSSTPQYTWSDHALPITDIICGGGGAKAHVFTSSLDQTCKLYSLASGELLCSFVFDCGITAITTDAAEYNLFAGLTNGIIHQVRLYEPGFKGENHIGKEDSLVFTGHTKQIGSLSVTMDGSLLLSGSRDGTARTWDVHSRQCLRTINHKGAVTNTAIMCHSHDMTESLPRSLWSPIQPFKRHLHTEGPSGHVTEETDRGISMILSDRLTESKDVVKEIDLVPSILNQNITGSDDKLTRSSKRTLSRGDLMEEVTKLKKINQDFYQFAVEELLQEVQNSLDSSKT